MDDPSAESSPNPELNPENLKKALKAFKKRLKLTRLDQESGLAGGPCSAGRKSGIVAIRPPSQFPREVWDALAAAGKLRTRGDGLYELAQP